MLHLTNGDAAAEPLRRAGLPGRVEVSADVLHEGPLLANLDERAWRATRCRFLAADEPGAVEQALETYAQWDAALHEARSHDEVVLWFEHDLFDQLILVRLLDWFSKPGAHPPALSLICIDRYPGVEPFHGLGQLGPEAFARLFPTRAPVTAEQTTLAHRTWAALTSPDPRSLEAIAATTPAALPFLPGAIVRLLEDYPSTFNGLGRTEQQALAAIDTNADTLADAFVEAAKREERVFMGDLVFLGRVAALAGGAEPLVQIGSEAAATSGGANARSLDATLHRMSAPVRLTDAGRAVLEGREDAVRLNGIDRWIGGVHLVGAEAEWRWDRSASRLVGAV